MVEHRTYIYHTDHLSDRQLYEELWDETLDESFPDMLTVSAEGGYFIDMLGSGSQEDTHLHMKYYTDEEERRQWIEEFPEDNLPPRVAPPYDRDRLLPEMPEGF
ncbi:hypothetical protein LCGC14_1962470 [marine sediment metagenome]|uniref:Uncharacterized protein n=1 Tax=marine sediment metagenome TaxID=412755 RepID=A0A0F9HSJ7_9ZZZZ